VVTGETIKDLFCISTGI